MSIAVITSVLAFIVAIGVLVSVHEFGHFWIARRLGFKVLRFSIGFGKPILTRIGRDPDRIEYVLAAIPLGGYVRLLDEREGPLPPGEEHRAFNRRPPLARIAVLLAGPGANFLFAIVAYWFLFLSGVPGLKPVIGQVAGGSLAEASDLRADDELLRVAGEPVATRQAAVLGILEQVVDGGRVTLSVRGGDGHPRELEIVVPAGERRALTEPGILLRGLGFSFWLPPQPVVVGELTAGEPAEAAGLAIGDVIIEVDRVPVGDFPAFVSAIRARPGQTTEIVALRDSARLSFTLVPRAVMEGGNAFGRIGLGASASAAQAFPAWMHTVEKYGPLASILPAVRETWQKSALTVRFLWRMVTGDVSTKNISGPINIAQYAGLTATEGFNYYLGFLALVSISLAVLNLLPVPVLDGGQVAFQLLEMAKGGPLSMQAQVFGQRLGIAMLVALMGIAFYNDITRLLG
ncbi:MAG TPA: RIP metalloprotease RseP [Steroidobacteraceae bacterium]|nr:RIP metalloprotease RseP [Steroidobacteraceae bacterium]